MKTKILVYLIIQLFVFVVCDEWGYGPKDGDWDDLDGAECDGKYQSPIDLIDVCNDTDGVVSVDSSLKIEFNNYDKPINAKDILFENNGHTAMITIKGSDEVGKNLPSISGSAVGKNETFQLQQIHFHWNRNGTHEGSEHSLYGHKTAFEMHFVHFNTKYGDNNEAGDHPDGSVVLSVLFDYFDCKEVSNDKKCDEETPENKALAPITKKLRDIDDADEVATLDDDLNLKILLPSNTDTFFWYQGSLTTPPCSEHLTWIVFPDVQNISKIQLESFEQNFKNEDGKILGTTNRDLQPLNNRLLIITNDDHCQDSHDKDDLTPVTGSENAKNDDSEDGVNDSKSNDGSSSASKSSENSDAQSDSNNDSSSNSRSDEETSDSSDRDSNDSSDSDSSDDRKTDNEPDNSNSEDDENDGKDDSGDDDDTDNFMSNLFGRRKRDINAGDVAKVQAVVEAIDGI